MATVSIFLRGQGLTIFFSANFFRSRNWFKNEQLENITREHRTWVNDSFSPYGLYKEIVGYNDLDHISHVLVDRG